jgi:hypothetical protein
LLFVEGNSNSQGFRSFGASHLFFACAKKSNQKKRFSAAEALHNSRMAGNG